MSELTTSNKLRERIMDMALAGGMFIGCGLGIIAFGQGNYQIGGMLIGGILFVKLIYG